MQVKTYEGPDVSRSDYLHLSEVEEMLFKDVQTCDVGIVWNQVGSSLWGKGAKNDQRLINQLAMGLPVVVYSGYAAFAAVADDMWCAHPTCTSCAMRGFSCIPPRPAGGLTRVVYA
jgi:hypothetical protein